MDPKTLTLAYLDAVAKKEYRALEHMLAPDLDFQGPSMSRTTAREFIGALERLSVIHVRNEVKRVFAEGNESCVVYDFVTDTPAGALPMLEWLRFDGSRIAAIRLYYDRLPWKTVMDEIGRRSGAPNA